LSFAAPKGFFIPDSTVSEARINALWQQHQTITLIDSLGQIEASASVYLPLPFELSIEDESPDRLKLTWKVDTSNRNGLMVQVVGIRGRNTGYNGKMKSFHYDYNLDDRLGSYTMDLSAWPAWIWETPEQAHLRLVIYRQDQHIVKMSDKKHSVRFIGRQGMAYSILSLKAPR
jgi:hypothetical protein